MLNYFAAYIRDMNVTNVMGKKTNIMRNNITYKI